MRQYNIQVLKINADFNSDEIVNSIKSIMKEANAHGLDLFNNAVWDWQYKNLPSKEAYVVIARNDMDKIVGYYHIPIYIGFVGHVLKKFAMVQSVAVSTSERGQGLFKQIANYATNFIEQNKFSLAYTFPNNKSIHTFIKYNNYNHISSLKTYILPINFFPLIVSKIKINVLAKAIALPINTYLYITQLLFSNKKKLVPLAFGEEVSLLYKSYYKQKYVYTYRSMEYLKWRFNEKPNGNYHTFGLRDANDKLVAFCVVKLDTLFKSNVLILMDFCFETEADFKALMRKLAKESGHLFKQKIALLFIGFQNNMMFTNIMSDFIKIPDKFNPRVVNLLVKDTNSNEPLLLSKAKWVCTFADWDVF